MEFINWIIRSIRQKNKGFDELAEKSKFLREGNHYTTFGGELEQKFGKQVINPNRNWKDAADKVKFEPQRRIVESMFCTVFNTENIIQTLQQYQYGFYEEYDEIPTANDAGVSPYTGGSPHSVAESIRHHGLFPAGTYPFDDSITRKEQLVMIPTQKMYAEASKWLVRWDFGHNWVTAGIVGNIQDAMWSALERSPLGVGVYAWVKNSDGMYYKPSWAKDNHWIQVIVEGEYGKYWVAVDTYLDDDGTKYKKIPWDYPFSWVKEYYLKKKDMIQQEAGKSLYERLKGKHIQRTEDNAGGHGEVYFIGTEEVVYEGWWTNSDWLQDGINTWLKGEYKKGTIIPVSEKDFEDLTSYIKLAGIPLKDDGLASVNKLNK